MRRTGGRLEFIADGGCGRLVCIPISDDGAGSGSSGGASAGGSAVGSNFKTKTCTFYLKGNCRYGSECKFAHGKDTPTRTPSQPPIRPCPDEAKQRGWNRLCRHHPVCKFAYCPWPHGYVELDSWNQAIAAMSATSGRPGPSQHTAPGDDNRSLDARDQLRIYMGQSSDAAESAPNWLTHAESADETQHEPQPESSDSQYLADQYRLVQELQQKREWDPNKYPQWLVFEVEGQLQIRPKQYAIARCLIENPGAIAQLNMGEGKTRVILPMLMLLWADSKRLVRIHILSQLLHEAFEYMHRHLCASSLGRKLFMLPFQRDVANDFTDDEHHGALNAKGAASMVQSLHYCQRCGGILLVAPEHRLSLFLKCLEPNTSPAVRAELAKMLELDVVDVFDESDEILRYQYQLIYAIGDHLLLPDGRRRWAAVHALLRIVKHDPCCMDILSQTNNHGHTVIANRTKRKSQQFDILQLLAGPKLESESNKLNQAIAKALLNDPPHEFRWLRHDGRQHPKIKQIIEFVTNNEKPAEAILTAEELAAPTQLKDLLAFRGLLAFGLLRHCLVQRHRVDYGVARGGLCKKRLAIPFRSLESPSFRAEFAHPECALVFTTLSYYYDGLSKAELEQGVKVLQSMGENAQRKEYGRWFESMQKSQDYLSADEKQKIDRVEKIDLSNEDQKNLLLKAFGENMEAINFWLSYCVFEVETMQYPQRLLATPWHLADNSRKRVVGFSGTNDTRRLYPLQVEQRETDDPDLLGTNGKMLDIILRQPYKSLESNEDAWKQLFDMSVQEGASALIDAGALMAGQSNREAALKLLERIPDTLKGVVFFDKNEWHMIDRDRSQCLLRRSPFREDQAFVYFDETQCRGSDMKMARDAKAIVTVGPNMCKDKLMQAVGRMRRLVATSHGQSIVLVGPVDITVKIKESASTDDLPCAADVLKWVMQNSIAATQNGLTSWANQGAHFCTTKQTPQAATLDETLKLEDFYSDAAAERPVVDVAKEQRKAYEKRRSEVQHSGLANEDNTLSSELRDMMEQITKRTVEQAESFQVIVTRFQEQCERELEKEVELEEEEEVEIPNRHPRKEVDWDYETVAPDTTFPLADRISQLLDGPDSILHDKLSSLAAIKWSDRVQCTPNFFLTMDPGSKEDVSSSDVARGRIHEEDVSNDDASSDGVDADYKKGELDLYLRVVDMVLQYSDGRLVLVSEREANGILAVIWKHVRGDTVTGECPSLVSLLHLRKGYIGQRKPVMQIPASGQCHKNMDAFIAAEVFNGASTFDTDEMKAAVRDVTSEAKEAPKKLLLMRGLYHTYDGSDLELVCEPDPPASVASSNR
eukprot:SAG22_NODE_79_length_21845_cov_17.798538_10_plen_1328_part_00